MDSTGYDLVKKFKAWVELYEKSYNDYPTNKPILRRLDELEYIISEAREYHKTVVNNNENQLSLEI
jgi:hypothetical protein